MIELIEGVTLYPQIQTVLAVDSSSIFDEQDMQPVEIGSHRIAPWGSDNNLPGEILGKVKKSDVVGTNLRFNRDVCYGLGPKLIQVIRYANGKVVDGVEDNKKGKQMGFRYRLHYQNTSSPLWTRQSPVK